MTTIPKAFIVMWPWSLDKLKLYRMWGCPETIPWAFIEPHEKQAFTNHHQTLQRLNERGGLEVVELRAVLEGKHWHDVSKNEHAAIQKLIALLDKWKER